MKSVLVIGLGRGGRHTARRFLEEGNEVLGVDISEERAEAALPFVPNVQIGDATNEEFVRSLGINNFDICVVAIGDNFPNALLATVLIKDLGGKFILGRASRDVHKKLLLRNGADHVVYPEREMAERLAVKYGSQNIFDCVELTPDYSIYEIAVPLQWRGKTIQEKSVRNDFHISILATKRNGVIYPLPQADHIFSGDESLIIIGHNKDVRTLTR